MFFIMAQRPGVDNKVNSFQENSHPQRGTTMWNIRASDQQRESTPNKPGGPYSSPASTFLSYCPGSRNPKPDDPDVPTI